MSRNNICEQQNSQEHLEMFAAASYYYGWAKFTLALQMIVTIGVAILISFILKFHPEAKVWTTFASITITWLDVLVLDRVHIYFRKRGALVQEKNDVTLFDLDWNDFRCGKPLDIEDVHFAGSRFLKCKGDSNLRDWYPKAIEELPLAVARLLCQRCCIRWDMDQRRRLRLFLIIFVSVGSFLALALAVYRGLSVEDLILTVYAPLAPAVIWCVREIRRQGDAAETLEKCRGLVEGIWKQAALGKIAASKLETTSRRIQDALFENRSKNPTIFNWIYRRLRAGKEEEMQVIARRLVDEALSNGI